MCEKVRQFDTIRFYTIHLQFVLCEYFTVSEYFKQSLEIVYTFFKLNTKEFS